MRSFILGGNYNWKVLPRPPDSLDIALSGYHLFFLSSQDPLSNKIYGNNNLKNDFDMFFSSKRRDLFF